MTRMNRPSGRSVGGPALFRDAGAAHLGREVEVARIGLVVVDARSSVNRVVALDPVERVEATFYAAMSVPNDQQSLDGLKQVASSEAIQLVEVTIARDLLASRAKLPKPKLPPNIALP